MSSYQFTPQAVADLFDMTNEERVDCSPCALLVSLPCSFLDICRHELFLVVLRIKETMENTQNHRDTGLCQLQRIRVARIVKC